MGSTLQLWAVGNIPFSFTRNPPSLNSCTRMTLTNKQQAKYMVLDTGCTLGNQPTLDPHPHLLPSKQACVRMCVHLLLVVLHRFLRPLFFFLQSHYGGFFTTSFALCSCPQSSADLALW